MNSLCNLCPNNCNVDRFKIYGRCSSSLKLKIAKYYLHPFEEPCLTGNKGSGTIFFCGCGLKCVFCQNYQVSRNTIGKEITIQDLVTIFKELEDLGAENINLVNPSHFVLQIIDAFNIYKPKIPIVYNTHAYEKIDSLKKINPFIDVYLPDIKFFSSNISKRYTNKEDYFIVASRAIEYMMSEKNTIFENSILKKGVIIRHLILPLCTQDSLEIIKWFKSHQRNNAYFSLMSQYTPFGDIEKYPELQRKITKREYNKVCDFLFTTNIKNCFIQGLDSANKNFIPKWDY